MQTETTKQKTIRFTHDVLDRLHKMAHAASLEEGKNVTACDIVREAVEEHLLRRQLRPHPQVRPANAGRTT